MYPIGYYISMEYESVRSRMRRIADEKTILIDTFGIMGLYGYLSDAIDELDPYQKFRQYTIYIDETEYIEKDFDQGDYEFFDRVIERAIENIWDDPKNNDDRLANVCVEILFDMMSDCKQIDRRLERQAARKGQGVNYEHSR